MEKAFKLLSADPTAEQGWGGGGGDAFQTQGKLDVRLWVT